MKIVLESEAASIYCQYMHLDDFNEQAKESYRDKIIPGYKYMVIDLGGNICVLFSFMYLKLGNS